MRNNYIRVDDTTGWYYKSAKKVSYQLPLPLYVCVYMLFDSFILYFDLYIIETKHLNSLLRLD